MSYHGLYCSVQFIMFKVLTVAAASILSFILSCTNLPNVSTDQLIASRRKEAEAKAPKKISKTVSNTDRSIANSRAKRSAAMDKKRGMRQESKPSAMQVEKEVSKQVKKTVSAKAKKQATPKGSVKVVMARNTPRRERQDAVRAQVKSRGPKKAEAAVLSHPPTKKAVTAAVNAMEEKGFSIPSGMQMVISFAPAPGAAAAVAKGGPQQQKNQRNAQPKAKNVQMKGKNDNGAQNNTGGNRRRARGRGGGKTMSID